MLPVREVLTLQFGNYANYIGAHWWNIQEAGFSYSTENDKPKEICHDVLYREGLTRNKHITYTPRLLLVDLNGSLKHLPIEGELYDKNNINSVQQQERDNQEEKNSSYATLKENISWKSSNVEVLTAAPSKKHEFQIDLDETCSKKNIEMKQYNFEQSVESWVDFLYTRYHPRTVNIINEYGYGPEKPHFDTYYNGTELWQSEMFKDHYCDRIRQYVEECDYFQGFQIICDNNNGFSGLTTECLIYLNDEYARANLTIPVYTLNNSSHNNADQNMSESVRLVNNILSFHQYSEQASLFIPLSTNERIWRKIESPRKFPHLNFTSNNLYQTSSILAAYLDTITLRYRLVGTGSTTSHTLAAFCADLNNYGRRLGGATIALPFPMPHDMDLIDYLDKLEQPTKLCQQLTPNCQLGLHNVVQNICIRGIPRERLKRLREEAQNQYHMPAYRCNSVSEMLQMYMHYISHNSITHVTSLSTPMPIRTPFPNGMFDNCLTSNGFINNQFKENKKVQSAPCLATVQTSNELNGLLECLIKEGKRIKIAKLNCFKCSDLESDNYTEALEHLSLFQNNYDGRYEI